MSVADSERKYKSGKGEGRKPGNRFTDTQREDIKAKIAQLDRRGYTQLGIVEYLHKNMGIQLTQGLVSVYLKQIQQTYKDSIAKDRMVLVQEKLEQYREIRREAWEAYERSKENSQKEVKEYERPAPKYDKYGNEVKPKKLDSRNAEDALELLRRVYTQEGRIPDNVFLRTVMQTLEAEREMLGTDAPQEVKHSGVMQINWDVVLKPQVEGNGVGQLPYDPIERKLLQLEGFPDKVAEVEEMTTVDEE